MAKFSKHQQNIIRNYYENRDAIALQRVQELVTELYLAEGKKRRKYWEQIQPHLAALGVPTSQIEHLVQQDKPELVARLVETLMDRS